MGDVNGAVNSTQRLEVSGGPVQSDLNPSRARQEAVAVHRFLTGAGLR